MRIITGSARGRKLITREGEDVRPTVERVKEALFSIIQFQIEGRRTLDLFAGSGQLGIETLSRGAASAVFVDASKESIAVVQKNLQSTGLGEKAEVYQSDFAAFLLRKTTPFDLVFLDPPYHTEMIQRALPMVAQIMNQGGTIICEHSSDDALPDAAGDFVKRSSRSYGKIVLTIYRHKDVIE